MSIIHRVFASSLLPLLLTLGGCTLYHPKPLPGKTPLSRDVRSLLVADAAEFGQTNLTHRVDPSDGLDLDEIGIIAALNNPDLKAQRAKAGVAGAQLFAAGLLPDPQLGAGIDKPTGNDPGLVNAWNATLGYDLIPLITRQANIDAARESLRQVRLDLLWQEWQVVQQARSLAVSLSLEGRRLSLLRRMRTLYQERYQRSSRALAKGDVTLDVNGTDLTALIDILGQIEQLKQTRNQTLHDFHLILGLSPQSTLNLAPLPARPTLPNTGVIRGRLDKLDTRRPDLLALKAGYASQEAKVRAAVMAQFPSLGISFNAARDTSSINTFGAAVSLSLPLLSGNRGNIAVARATREQLRREYEARWATARNDVDRLLDLQKIYLGYEADLRNYLPHLKQMVNKARKAYSRDEIDALTFLNMESTWIKNRLELISLKENIWQNQLALETLLVLPDHPGSDIPQPADLKDSAP